MVIKEKFQKVSSKFDDSGRGGKKVLVANRGEIAVRIMRTLREMGIKTVGIYSTDDRDALHRLYADEAICIGPAKSSQSYLNIPAICSAVEITGANAIHPGYGFLSENSKFAEIVKESGVIFIGPSPEIIDLMGNKIKSREFAKSCGVSVVPGIQGSLNTKTILEFADEFGFPLLIKSAFGGGGRGMKIIQKEDDIDKMLEIAGNEAKGAFGNGELYLEKYFENARHVEVQLLGDGKGKVIHLGTRECSIQRRHQKVIEEAPFAFFEKEGLRRICADAVELGIRCNYIGAGTVEFILDEEGHHYFLEMNTRIQVEHPVTEEITSIDMVKEMVDIAYSGSIDLMQDDIDFQGHSIECRVCAEDPENLTPSTGVIEKLVLPGGFGVRVDSGIIQGSKVSQHYDPLLMKIIVWGRNRMDAIHRMKRALAETVLTGISTNIPLLKKVFEDADFIDGRINTRFLQRFVKKF